VGFFQGGNVRRTSGRLTILWAAIVVVTVLATQFYFGRTQVPDLSDTRFVEEVEKGNIQKLAVTPGTTTDEIRGELKTAAPVTVNGREVSIKEFRTFYAKGNVPLSRMVWAKNPGIEIVTRPAPSSGTMIATWVPVVVLIAAWFFLVRRMQQAPKAES